ncbi:M3 family metallopeptidase [Micrococcales bacterium 31B]|nr:M3 family metallopeptidase [Micrococcales bacterium 31B]
MTSPAASPFDLPELPADNPFRSLSPLPYALENFEAIRPEHYGPALDAAMARLRATLASVIASPDAPTFDNTLLPLEIDGAAFARVSGVLNIVDSSHQTPEVREVTVEYEPKMAAIHTELSLSPELLQRVEAILESPALDGEQRRVAEMYRDDLRSSGAGLGPAERARLQEIASELSSLGVTYSANLVDASKAADFWVSDVADLDGLSESRIGAARAAAEASDPERFAREGGYLLEIRGLSNLPEVRELTNRAMRERVYLAANSRCVEPNLEIACREAALRAEMAKLLGHESYHALFTSVRTAKTPAAVAAVLQALTPPAVATAEVELAAIREAAARDGIEQVEAWDISFYTERLKAERFNLDFAALRQYFELTNVVERGIFFAAEKLYGLTFVPRPELHGYLPDVKVWEVFDGSPGTPNEGMALFVADFFSRDTKRPGAWMNAFRFANSSLAMRPVVINNCNYVKPTGDDPCLLTLQDVRTLFHEFGHALHGLLARSTYRKTCAFEVPWDFIEFPSQVNEMWALWPEVLENYALHVETGEILPQATVDAIEASRLWGLGLATCHQLTNNAVDIGWHSLPRTGGSASGAPTTPAEAVAFERDLVLAAGIPFPHLSERRMSASYTHIFAGGYSGGYYTYLWSETFDADTVAWYKSNGGLTRENGDRYRALILGIAATRDPLDAYREFRGRDVAVEPLLERNGFLVA